jgi:hypothetical protein
MAGALLLALFLLSTLVTIRDPAVDSPISPS